NACKLKPKKYDFVIAGGGLAGCIVATRLSENPSFKVVLIEAGSDPPLISKVPMLSFLLMNSKYDWNYTTIPQSDAADRVFGMIRGKMLGGSGSLNTLNWFRGNKRDYDIWQNEGADGWDWNSLLPYFKKTETDLSTDANSASSGFGGPIPLTNPWK
ncbi:putative alcohol dehydrogenase-like protein, partial [Leptotrombidium deliense]